MASASPTLITPEFVFSYPSPATVSDYRSVVDKTGAFVIFERSAVDLSGALGLPQLYLYDLAGGGALPGPFLGGSPAIDTSTRPDWSWVNGLVAFNYSGLVMVGVVSSSGQNPKLFGDGTVGMNYPTWFPDGATLATESDNAVPDPNTTTISAASGATLKTVLEGTGFWGGMPSVNPVNPNLIAFAGQTWVKGQKYQQDYNYIYVMDLSSANPPVPLEYNAPMSGNYDPAFQGRAPWWSPDGKWVVFESNRPTQFEANGLYAIYLYEYGVPNPGRQITNTIYNCNHAKWYPFGFPGYPAGDFKLTVAAWQGGGTTPTGPYGLATLDLTALNIPF